MGTARFWKEFATIWGVTSIHLWPTHPSPNIIQVTFSILKTVCWLCYLNISILNKILFFVSQWQRVHSPPPHTYYGTYVPCSPYTHPEYRVYSSQQLPPGWRLPLLLPKMSMYTNKRIAISSPAKGAMASSIWYNSSCGDDHSALPPSTLHIQPGVDCKIAFDNVLGKNELQWAAKDAAWRLFMAPLNQLVDDE